MRRRRRTEDSGDSGGAASDEIILTTDISRRRRVGGEQMSLYDVDALSYADGLQRRIERLPFRSDMQRDEIENDPFEELDMRELVAISAEEEEKKARFTASPTGNNNQEEDARENQGQFVGDKKMMTITERVYTSPQPRAPSRSRSRERSRSRGTSRSPIPIGFGADSTSSSQLTSNANLSTMMSSIDFEQSQGLSGDEASIILQRQPRETAALPVNTMAVLAREAAEAQAEQSRGTRGLRGRPGLAGTGAAAASQLGIDMAVLAENDGRMPVLGRGVADITEQHDEMNEKDSEHAQIPLTESLRDGRLAPTISARDREALGAVYDSFGVYDPLHTQDKEEVAFALSVDPTDNMLPSSASAAALEIQKERETTVAGGEINYVADATEVKKEQAGEKGEGRGISHAEQEQKAVKMLRSINHMEGFLPQQLLLRYINQVSDPASTLPNMPFSNMPVPPKVARVKAKARAINRSTLTPGTHFVGQIKDQPLPETYQMTELMLTSIASRPAFSEQLRRPHHIRAKRAKMNPSETGSDVCIVDYNYNYEADHAAIIIHSVYRKYLTWWVVWGPNGVRDHWKANHIQRVWKGFKTRQWVQQYRLELRIRFAFETKLCTQMQKVVRGFLGRIYFAKEKKYKYGAAIILQCAQRQFRARERVKMRRYIFHKWSALKVQRVFRGHRARQKVRAMLFYRESSALWKVNPWALVKIALFALQLRLWRHDWRKHPSWAAGFGGGGGETVDTSESTTPVSSASPTTDIGKSLAFMRILMKTISESPVVAVNGCKLYGHAIFQLQGDKYCLSMLPRVNVDNYVRRFKSRNGYTDDGPAKTETGEGEKEKETEKDDGVLTTSNEKLVYLVICIYNEFHDVVIEGFDPSVGKEYTRIVITHKQLRELYADKHENFLKGAGKIIDLRRRLIQVLALVTRSDDTHLVLPALERAQRRIALRDAALKIQRRFRGHQGKNLYQLVREQMAIRRAQQETLRKAREKRSAKIALRNKCAAKIAAQMRGVIYRAHMLARTARIIQSFVVEGLVFQHFVFLGNATEYPASVRKANTKAKSHHTARVAFKHRGTAKYKHKRRRIMNKHRDIGMVGAAGSGLRKAKNRRLINGSKGRGSVSSGAKKGVYVFAEVEQRHTDFYVTAYDTQSSRVYKGVIHCHTIMALVQQFHGHWKLNLHSLDKRQLLSRILALCRVTKKVVGRKATYEEGTEWRKAKPTAPAHLFCKYDGKDLGRRKGKHIIQYLKRFEQYAILLGNQKKRTILDERMRETGTAIEHVLEWQDPIPKLTRSAEVAKGGEVRSLVISSSEMIARDEIERQRLVWEVTVPSTADLVVDQEAALMDQCRNGERACSEKVSHIRGSMRRLQRTIAKAEADLQHWTKLQNDYNDMLELEDREPLARQREVFVLRVKKRLAEMMRTELLNLLNLFSDELGDVQEAQVRAVRRRTVMSVMTGAAAAERRYVQEQAESQLPKVLTSQRNVQLLQKLLLGAASCKDYVYWRKLNKQLPEAWAEQEEQKRALRAIENEWCVLIDSHIADWDEEARRNQTDTEVQNSFAHHRNLQDQVIETKKAQAEAILKEDYEEAQRLKFVEEDLHEQQRKELERRLGLIKERESELKAEELEREKNVSFTFDASVAALTAKRKPGGRSRTPSPDGRW